MKRLVLPALAALSLGACATTPTTYQPATGPQAVGYSEYRIEPDRYRVTFRGGPGASADRVTDLALLRAADLALAGGYDWFRVSDRFLQGQPNRGPRISLGVGGGSGHYGYRSGSSVGVGLGTGFNLGGGPSVTATLEVLLGRGPKPPGGDVYDARAIRSTLMGTAT
ncbi:CC0125/CC1285 family lipoprotein [Phenylobacterium sp.]|uniref:CC0125/CC1285 family lipoprotein n=1 Tax=Phenylobacterium sp. TaxID=1871053 RepID=UPI002C2B2C7B|nr:hypothetical protein [Phenylobacterium sp.]HVI30721.1 hypothetical protein [Phenylobacterium sp.]